MIQTSNHTINIKRLNESISWEKTYKQQANWIRVYIEPIQDEVWQMFDWQSAFNVFRMFSDYEIIQGDKLTDENNIEYKVKWVRFYTSLVGSHYESLINSTYD